MKPPRVARWLLERALPADAREHVLGDLHELFEWKVEERGVLAAGAWYWGQTASFALRFARERALDWNRDVSQGIGSDFRYVLRVLRRSPGFTMIAVLSLALGIGANTAMFGVVRGLLLTPLPVEAPDELTLLGWTRSGQFGVGQIGATNYFDPESGVAYRSNFSYPMYRALRDATPDGAELFAFAFLRGVSVGLGDRPPSLAGGALVDGAYFATLGMGMELGRPLEAADDRPDAPLVAVLGHGFWMRAFGGDLAVIGSTIRVNGTAAEVVGVTNERFKGLSIGGFFPPTDITVPLAAQPRVYPRMSPDRSLFTADDVLWLRLMARVPEGVPWAAAEQVLGAAFRAQPSPLSGDADNLPVLRLLPGAHGAQPVRAETLRLVYLLLGVMGIVLLIACVNLAGLMLARGVARQREFTVRRALGGGRVRLVRQLLLEGLVLAGAGTAAGLVITVWGRGLLADVVTSSLGGGAFARLDLGADVDSVVLGVSAALGIAATMLFGLFPALRLSRADPGGWLKQRGSSASSPRLSVHRALMAMQIAVTVPLVVGAALLLRTVVNLADVELGFDPEGLVTFQVDPGFTRLSADEYPHLYQELLARLEAIPGVTSATLIENAPMSGLTSNGKVTVDGRDHVVYQNAVGPAFLETLGMRLLSGRMPGVQDDLEAPRVGAVNETAVRDLFSGASPIGRMIQIGGRDVEVIGVINDAPYASRREPVPPTLYESALQREGYGGHHVVLRTDVPPARLESTIREAIAQVDPDIPVPDLRTQTAIMAQTGARERVLARLLSIFGGFALLLASIGLHGVTSYSVTRRTSEIGVRVAVGARPRQILWLVLRQVVWLAAVGVAVGVAASLAAGRVVASLLFGVAPTDAAALGLATTVMLVVAVAAGLAPALRAARMDALMAIRTE